MKVPTYKKIKCPNCKKKLKKKVGCNLLCNSCLCRINGDNSIWNNKKETK